MRLAIELDGTRREVETSQHAETATLGDLGGKVECGEMAVREESRGLLLPTAIFARWSKD